jgi:hypothetical protein
VCLVVTGSNNQLKVKELLTSVAIFYFLGWGDAYRVVYTKDLDREVKMFYKYNAKLVKYFKEISH